MKSEKTKIIVIVVIGILVIGILVIGSIIYGIRVHSIRKQEKEFVENVFNKVQDKNEDIKQQQKN